MTARARRISGGIAAVAVLAFAVGEITDVFAYGLAAVLVSTVLVRGYVVRDRVLLEAELVPWAAHALNIALVLFIASGPIVRESGTAGWRSAFAAVLFGVLARLDAHPDEAGPAPAAVRTDVPEQRL